MISLPESPSLRDARAAGQWSLETLRRTVQEAVDLKTRFRTATHRALCLRDHLARLEEDVMADRPPRRTDLQQLYAAAGFELPGVALRRFEEVEIFYDSVNANRRAHLAAEAAEVRSQAEELERQAIEAEQARNAILKTLEEQDVADHLLAMLRNLAEAATQESASTGQIKTQDLGTLSSASTTPP